MVRPVASFPMQASSPILFTETKKPLPVKVAAAPKTEAPAAPAAQPLSADHVSSTSCYIGAGFGAAVSAACVGYSIATIAAGTAALGPLFLAGLFAFGFFCFAKWMFDNGKAAAKEEKQAAPANA